MHLKGNWDTSWLPDMLFKSVCSLCSVSHQVTQSVCILVFSYMFLFLLTCLIVIQSTLVKLISLSHFQKKSTILLQRHYGTYLTEVRLWVGLWVFYLVLWVTYLTLQGALNPVQLTYVCYVWYVQPSSLLWVGLFCMAGGWRGVTGVNAEGQVCCFFIFLSVSGGFIHSGLASVLTIQGGSLSFAICLSLSRPQTHMHTYWHTIASESGLLPAHHSRICIPVRLHCTVGDWMIACFKGGVSSDSLKIQWKLRCTLLIWRTNTRVQSSISFSQSKCDASCNFSTIAESKHTNMFSLCLLHQGGIWSCFSLFIQCMTHLWFFFRK